MWQANDLLLLCYSLFPAPSSLYHHPSYPHAFHPHHLVLATGIFAQKPIMPEIPGQNVFTGQAYHAMHHKAARRVPSLPDKNVVILGSGTSAHDIAQDFVNSGAKSVSIVQRHAIFSVSTKAIEDTYFSLWAQPGVSTEEADIIANSFPTAVVRTLNIGQTAQMEEHDKELMAGMEKAGFLLKKAREVGYGLSLGPTPHRGSMYSETR